MVLRISEETPKVCQSGSIQTLRFTGCETMRYAQMKRSAAVSSNFGMWHVLAI